VVYVSRMPRRPRIWRRREVGARDVAMQGAVVESPGSAIRASSPVKISSVRLWGECCVAYPTRCRNEPFSASRWGKPRRPIKRSAPAGKLVEVSRNRTVSASMLRAGLSVVSALQRDSCTGNRVPWGLCRRCRSLAGDRRISAASQSRSPGHAHQGRSYHEVRVRRGGGNLPSNLTTTSGAFR